MVSTDQIKQLRDRTGISVMQCKKALEEAKGDLEKALILLRRKGTEVASKKATRELGAGVIASYIHSDGRVGTLVELLCETDFVAKNNEFKNLADEIAMHITAMNPMFLSEKDITDGDKKKAKEAFKEETEKLDKPSDVKEKILHGKLDAYFKEKVLLTQPYIKDQDISIQELVEKMTQKMGERIHVGRFTRYGILE